MTHRVRRLSAVLSVIVGLCLTAVRARADIYSVYNLGNDNIGQFVEGDDYGDYVISVNNSTDADYDCGYTADHCYEVALPGAARFETTIPTLLTDSASVAGPGCVAKPSDFAGNVFCNNGHQIFSGYFNIGINSYLGVFDGTDPLTDRVGFGTAEPNSILTANGDLYFDNGLEDELQIAIDISSPPGAVATTPEPSSIALLGTGMIGIAGVVRKRFV